MKDPKKEMRAFDKLPPVLQALHREHGYLAQCSADYLKRGMSVEEVCNRLLSAAQRRYQNPPSSLSSLG